MKKLLIISLFFFLIAGTAFAGSPPTADAGPNQTVYEGVTVTLDGSKSSDPDNDIVSYNWTQISGTPVTLSDSTASRPVFDAPDADTDGDSLTFKLKVADTDGLQSTDTCIVSVLWVNASPVADAGPDRTFEEGFTVTLDGSGSSDPDDNILSYEWTQTAGRSVTLSDSADIKPVFTTPDVGQDGDSLEFKLKVTDSSGLESTDTCVINVTWINTIPIAYAGPNQTVDEGAVVMLDGSGSSDPDDEIVSYEWTQTAGPPVALSDPSGITPSFTAPEAGPDGASLSFSLRVTDSGGLESSDICIINISWIKDPPVADPGEDRTVKEGVIVTLDGSGSSDPDNDIVSYQWIQTSGHPVVLSDSTAIRPTFTTPDVGPGGASLVFSLKVTDSSGLHSSDTCNVKVLWVNAAPVAHAGPDRRVSGGVTVTLDGSGSSDPDDGIASYQWKQLSGPLVYLSGFNDANATLIAPDSGQGSISLAFSLTVRDSQGLEGTDTCIVNISRSNTPPIASAGPDQRADEGATVILDGSGSSDSDDGITFYEWTQTGGIPVTISDSALVRPFFKAPDVGPHGASLIFNLKVSDSGGLQSTDTCKISISWVNEVPTADAGPNQTVDEGLVAVLDGSGSSDSENDIVLYEWTQISGTPVTLSDSAMIRPVFTTPDVGPHGASLTFKLKVTDSGGLQSADTCIVNVSWVNDSPSANAGSDQKVYEGVSVILDGSGSSDPDDGIAFYEWTQVSGEPVVTLSDTGAILSSFTAPDPDSDEETLVFELTVTDNGGLESSDKCSIKVMKKGVQDRDGDKIPDDQDAFPDDADEWLDTDKDGIGNNADPDDDDDGMPDEWEQRYNLNPLADDAFEDPDRDGIRNIDEYKAGSDPNHTQGKTYEPVLTSPANGLAGVSLTPEFQTEAFSDPDNGTDKKHAETEWQISNESDFSSLVLDITSSHYLTLFTVPEFILDRYTTYYWRARFFFNDNSISEWPVPFSFTTTLIPSEEDRNLNGIPDNQEITDLKVDLDSDGVPDADQVNISSLKTTVGDAQVGLRGLTNVTSVESVKTADPNDMPGNGNRPEDMLFGFTSFELNVDNPGDIAIVTLYFSEPVPDGDKWYNYDAVNGWWDYSDHAVFSDDRKSVRLELKDGGFGDSDGIENGVIIDQSGFGTPQSGSSGGSGDSSDSCFIAASRDSLVESGRLFLALVLIGFAGVMIFGINKSDLQRFYDKAVSYDNANKIDPLDNLKNRKVYIFSGMSDQTVRQQVTDWIDNWYGLTGMPGSNIFYKNDINAGHALPTDDYGNPQCSVTGNPWMNDCDYDGAGEALKHIYGSLNPASPVTSASGKFIRFPQNEFFEPGNLTKEELKNKYSMNEFGFAYVPKSCTNGEQCRIHVVFHGCQQIYDEPFGLKMVRYAGYNEWANTNNLIILYPQAQKASRLGNPNGCYDWWGYIPGTTETYATKEGPQMKAVYAMIKRIAGAEPACSGGNKAPTIELKGDARIEIEVGARLVLPEPEATASDPEDGDITGRVTRTPPGALDTSQAGTYILKYNVKDSGECEAKEVTRTIIVGKCEQWTAINSVHKLEGRARSMFCWKHYPLFLSPCYYAAGSNDYLGYGIDKTTLRKEKEYYKKGGCQ